MMNNRYVEILNTIVNLPLSSLIANGFSASSTSVSESWLILSSAVSPIKDISFLRACYIGYQFVVCDNRQERTVLQEPEGISYWKQSPWQQAFKENTHNYSCNCTGYRLKKCVSYTKKLFTS